MALPGELAVEQAMSLPQDRLLDDDDNNNYSIL